ncbi:hypothetical protein OBBRIDRAFT_525948 [Obba rivulosa]|uniref:Uncharacterized protein n=1 Tax=Obba rivulosa TaxID=1052685 RepID=A0A8E2DNU2_9APHY|nr:hypothetical protein OBBRIDRAFT_525948 [Obba rivulosa]
MPTISAIIDAQSPSESAALHGHKAKTPEISGIVSGSAVGLLWTVGLVMYLWKRRQRTKQARASGLKSHRELLDPPKKPQAFIIPPDPAIIQGCMVPGERVIVDESSSVVGPIHPYAKSEPLHCTYPAWTSAEGLPPMEHGASAPCVLSVETAPVPSAAEMAERLKMDEPTRHSST